MSELDKVLREDPQWYKEFHSIPFTTDYTQSYFAEDLRAGYVRQMIDQKEKLIEEAFRLLIGDEDIKIYKGRLRCLVNPAKVETYTLDDIPVIEIYPMEFKNEYNEQGDPTLTAYYSYRILYKGDKNAV